MLIPSQSGVEVLNEARVWSPSRLPLASAQRSPACALSLVGSGGRAYHPLDSTAGFPFLSLSLLGPVKSCRSDLVPPWAPRAAASLEVFVGAEHNGPPLIPASFLHEAKTANTTRTQGGPKGAAHREYMVVFLFSGLTQPHDGGAKEAVRCAIAQKVSLYHRGGWVDPVSAGGVYQEAARTPADTRTPRSGRPPTTHPAAAGLPVAGARRLFPACDGGLGQRIIGPAAVARSTERPSGRVE
ncbi:hypothetical protein LZ31DRAFT_292301 [Colletotrichum somersetense]|nr:hypothetical protein LZ31DRAFT_292301 [Colletotrichum somersetense]